MNEATASLAEIDRQRAALAARVRLPVWYRALWAFALLALFAVPLFQGVWSWLVVFVVIQAPAIVVLSLSSRVLYWSSGAQLARNVLGAYPSSRWPMIGMVAAVLVGCAIEIPLIIVGLVPIGVVVGILAVTVATVCLDRHLAGVRADIRDGRVVSS